MTEAQRKAAVERLAKARQARKKKPTELKNVHPDVAKLPSDHYLSYDNCKKYLKACKEQISAARSDMRRNVKGASAQYHIWKGYEGNINTYIRNGDWLDDFYGEDHNKRILWTVTRMAYHDSGKPKRIIGYKYPDVGAVWTQEMEDEEMQAFGLVKKQVTTVKSRKRKRIAKAK